MPRRSNSRSSASSDHNPDPPQDIKAPYQHAGWRVAVPSVQPFLPFLKSNSNRRIMSYTTTATLEPFATVSVVEDSPTYETSLTTGVAARPGPPLRPYIDPANLPPLPEIQSDEIRKQVFTHRSYFARPTHVFEDTAHDPSPDNEMLEHLGDAVLSMVVTSYLTEVFPHLRVGPSTKIRALVVGNNTLAGISALYNLPDRLFTHPAQAITLRASTNIQADLFESYVGGVFRDGGIDAVKAWLEPLFRPYLVEAYRLVRVQHGLSPDPDPAVSPLAVMLAPGHPASGSQVAATVGHLSLFNQCLQQANKSVEWEFSDSAGQGTKTTPIWAVRAIVDRQCLGRGRGNTKKAAKNEAAKEGLKTMGVYVPIQLGTSV
ncbi:ribonuclease III [Trametopsis cervina]|nr:ribonuclease III [Trametopsis cervina]